MTLKGVFSDFSNITFLTPKGSKNTEICSQKFPLSVQIDFSELIGVAKLKIGTHVAHMTLLRYFYHAHATAALPATSKSINLHLLLLFYGSKHRFYPSAERGIVIIVCLVSVWCLSVIFFVRSDFSESVKVRKLKFGTNDVYITI